MGGNGAGAERAGRSRKRARAHSGGAQWWRKLALPRRGRKDSLLSPAADADAAGGCVSGAQVRKLARKRSALAKAVGAARGARAKHMAVADWDAGAGEASVAVARGGVLASMGRFTASDGGGAQQRLRPEEALFLVDRGALDLRAGGRPLSLQGAWAALAGARDALPLEAYLAFAHLRRAGYVVRRAPVALAAPGALPLTLAAWRAGAFRRKDPPRPLFYVAAVACAAPPPSPAAVAAALARAGRSRVRVALIDRGVVVVTDMACNATPLSDRFRKRLRPSLPPPTPGVDAPPEAQVGAAAAAAAHGPSPAAGSPPGLHAERPMASGDVGAAGPGEIVNGGGAAGGSGEGKGGEAGGGDSGGFTVGER